MQFHHPHHSRQQAADALLAETRTVTPGLPAFKAHGVLFDAVFIHNYYLKYKKDKKNAANKAAKKAKKHGKAE